jgi:hypothetical protein
MFHFPHCSQVTAHCSQDSTPCYTPKSEFFFRKKNANSEVDVEALDVFFNLTLVSTQLMNWKMPWRGGTKKDSELMQILIKALTTSTLVFLDAYASIGWLISYSKTYYIISQCVSMKSL